MDGIAPGMCAGHGVLCPYEEKATARKHLVVRE
jgi:hypothetical protein